MFFERRHLRTVAAVLALTMAGSLTGCGTTGSSTTPATTVKNVILVIGDGMQLEHERAANNYLFGNYTEGLAFWKFPYQGQASTWDVTTYNKFAAASSDYPLRDVYKRQTLPRGANSPGRWTAPVTRPIC